jgi:hypothetical protein
MNKRSSTPLLDDGERYLIPVEAADFLRLSIRTLERYRVEGTGPKFIKVGRGKRARVLYRLTDLRAWLDGSVYQSTAEYSGTGKKNVKADDKS